MGEEFDGGAGDGGGGVLDGAQQDEHAVGFVAGGEGIEGELQ